jgi:hypothetical protein
MDQAMAVRAEKADVREPGRSPGFEFTHRREVVALNDPLDSPLGLGVETARLACKGTSSPQHLPSLPMNQTLVSLPPSMRDDLDGRLIDLVVLVVRARTLMLLGVRQGTADLPSLRLHPRHVIGEVLPDRHGLRTCIWSAPYTVRVEPLKVVQLASN